MQPAGWNGYPRRGFCWACERDYESLILTLWLVTKRCMSSGPVLLVGLPHPRMTVALVAEGRWRALESQISVRRLSAQPPEHPPQGLGALFLVSVGSSHNESFANPGNTLTFASRDCLNVSLQV